MKKGLKIFLIIIALFIAAMIIVPYFFKDDILEMAKSEANKNLNAKVDFGEIELSMFRDFPNLSVKINDITVSGVNEFKNKTLVKIGSVGASVNLGSLFGSAIKTDEIFLENTYFNAIINKKGIANWDIVKNTDSKEITKEEKKSSSMPEVIFKNIRLENINVKFTDHKEETYFSSNGININVSGNFSEENTNINFVMGTPDTNVEYGGIKYLNKAILSFEAQIAANLKNKYSSSKRINSSLIRWTFLLTVALT